MENTLNIEDIKGRIKSIHLLLLKKNTNFSNGLEPLKAYIKNDIFDDIKKIYIKPLESIFSNCELENFSYDSSLDGAIPFLSTSELTHSSVFSSLLNSISSIDSIKSLKTFENTLSESYLYAFIFTLDDSKTFTVVRKIYALNYLKNKGLLTFKDSRLNFIQDDLFALDPKIDCIIYDNSVMLQVSIILRLCFHIIITIQLKLLLH
ncbi:hypothetical protein H477_3897 [[Clostridium] sordellii ATCC 9714]|nr:hypothetical protein H477_3897 [[Clostridium] sordellii ATCC 9714] [Paeniclostridium sordellii ATCC 9714]